MKFILLLTSLFLMAGCFDPPLLKTELPNGYSFHSNGGIFGYITRPNGSRMSDYFGILRNGEEQWCNEFGWADNYVACELEVVNKNSPTGYTTKYFIMNTANEKIAIIPTLEKARSEWRKNQAGNFPKLQKRYNKTKEK